jgi:hypothetical protein
MQRLLRFDAVTQIAWGERYEHGEGVPKSSDKAVRLYCAAARRGNARAQYRLGWMYAHGRGVPRDDGLAAAWFRLAADQGDPQSAQMLTHLTSAGRHVKARCVGGQMPDLLLGPVGIASVSVDSAQRKAVAEAVRRLAARHSVDPNLVLAVIQAESGFDARAVSPKGAMGLMQLMPFTAERFGVRDAFDPEQNLSGGMTYLRWLLDRFEGKVPLAVAAYNAGEEAVDRYGGIPPYAETQGYVQRVMRHYPHLTHPVSRRVEISRRVDVAEREPKSRGGNS